MSDGTLSQDEIDALLNEAAGDISPLNEQEIEVGGITDKESSNLNKIISDSLSSTSVVFGTILNKNVSIENVTSGIKDISDVSSGYDKKLSLSITDLTNDIKGKLCVLLSLEDSVKIADIMLGETTEIKDEIDLSDQQKSALQEAMNQFFSSFTNSLSEKTGGTFANGLVETISVMPEEAISKTEITGEAFITDAVLNVEGIIESKIRLVMSGETSRNLVNLTTGGPSEFTLKETKTQVKTSDPPKSAVSTGTPITAAGGVEVKPVQFQQFGPTVQESLPTNMQLLLDVPMDVTVELGRTRKLVRDILELGTGSIIELDKLAGEPVDIMVNGKLIAKGEVVVIDENFGVRVTDIISPMERLNNLQ